MLFNLRINIQEEPEAKLVSRKLYSPTEFTPAQGTSFDFVPSRSPPELTPDSPSVASRPSPSFAPTGSPSSAPGAANRSKASWCVAKPSAQVEQLQEAMDYACGEGGADCEEIRPDGRCYYPDNLVAHASFAFNSYWQNKKDVGGTCSFDGAAVLVDSDPSSLLCQFMHT